MSSMNNIDIEKVMDEIRTEAKMTPVSIDTFYEIDTPRSDEVNRDINAQLSRMGNAVGNAIGNCDIAAERPTGGGLGGIFKKILRKLCRFFVVPIVHDQNIFNRDAANALAAAYDLITINNTNEPSLVEEMHLLTLKVNRDMQGQIDKLIAENKRLSQEVEQLKEQVNK